MKLVTASALTALFYCAGANAEHPKFGSQVVSNFGMIGLSKYDTARLTLVNTADPEIINIIPNLCQAKLRFRDAGGQIVAKSEVVLGNGQAGHLDLTHKKIPGDARRAQVRAEVATLDDPVTASVANCVATVEVFNTRSGRTYSIYPDAPQLFLGGPIVIEPPIPGEPPPTPIPVPSPLQR